MSQTERNPTKRNEKSRYSQQFDELIEPIYTEH